MGETARTLEFSVGNTGELERRASPIVSVCLLTYNHEHVIEGVLQSILNQTYRDFELIVSDDCSTDATWEIIERIARKDPRVRPVRTTQNLGMAGNANFAAGLAAGDYIALLHHDDFIASTLFEKWLDVAVESRDIGFVFNDYLVRSESSHASEGIQFDRRMHGKGFLRKYLLSRWGCPVRGTALINKSCFDSVGGMREEFSLLADIDLWMRLAARWDVGYVSEPLIQIGWTRPSDYPEDYTAFSWHRLKILFEIHATNFGAIAPSGSISRRVAWWMFRSRVSAEAVKWLLYAMVRRKRAMLTKVREGANEYEWWPVRALREVMQAIFGIGDAASGFEVGRRQHGKREG